MIDQNTIYLDNQATTPVSPKVADAMMPFFGKLYGNPHSNDHIKGWEAHKKIEESRMVIARFLGVDDDEIIFTSGATEANNMAIKGLEYHLLKAGKNKIVVSAIEHKCVLESASHMKTRGFEVIILPVNHDGMVTVEELEVVMSENVGLVSVMLVNNEIGTIQPINDLAAIARKYGALFHTDAAQAPVFYDFRKNALHVDFISLSGHKAHGPKGIGALYARRSLKDKLKPLIHGGGQEDGLRSGTLSTALCVGMGVAFEDCYQHHARYEAILREHTEEFLNILKKHIPQIKINGNSKNRHPGNLNLYFPNIKASELLQSMQPLVAASSGSACNSGIESPSYVLDAIGLAPEKAASSIRFSFGVNQTSEEVREAAEIVCEKYDTHVLLNCAA
jgi:cysteine desulfurase